jgi:hypothetical protein
MVGAPIDRTKALMAQINYWQSQILIFPAGNLSIMDYKIGKAVYITSRRLSGEEVEVVTHHINASGTRILFVGQGCTK